MKISIGFFSGLTLILITLKLIGIISWNWLLVLFPVMFPIYLIVAILLLSVICTIIIAIKDALN